VNTAAAPAPWTSVRSSSSRSSAPPWPKNTQPSALSSCTHKMIREKAGREKQGSYRPLGELECVNVWEAEDDDRPPQASAGVESFTEA
jgi:hypothetical protein